jgi:hypothetical protein
VGAIPARASPKKEQIIMIKLEEIIKNQNKTEQHKRRQVRDKALKDEYKRKNSNKTSSNK